MGGAASPLARRASWFKPELRTKDYSGLGDAYDDARYQALAVKCAVPQPANDMTYDNKCHDDDYLILVKQASARKWIDLQLLADLMQIGRIPRNWSDDLLIERINGPREYSHSGLCGQCGARGDIANGKGEGLNTKQELRNGANRDPAFRLLVVEDLSRNVIEALSTEFDITPDFFRAHIADYAWYNVHDRWREPQPLEVMRSKRHWF